MIKIGDKIRKKVCFGGNRSGGGGVDDTRATGTVVYIHPKERYFVLKFETRDGCFCESYTLDAEGA